MDNTNLTYESAIEQLESITKKLETGDLQLEDAIANYQKAIELIKFCKGKLDGAAQQIVILTDDGNGGKTEKPF